MWPNPQFSADLVTYIDNGKLNFCNIYQQSCKEKLWVNGLQVKLIVFNKDSKDSK